jgi:hypothetical protein
MRAYSYHGQHATKDGYRQASLCATLPKLHAKKVARHFRKTAGVQLFSRTSCPATTSVTKKVARHILRAQSFWRATFLPKNPNHRHAGATSMLQSHLTNT